MVYFGGFFPKLKFSRGFLCILFTGRNSATAIAGDFIFFSLAGPVGDYTGVQVVIYSQMRERNSHKRALGGQPIK